MFMTSVLRTLLPIWWGSFVLWLLAMVPALEPIRDLLLGQETLIVNGAVAIALAGWYALCRWLEPHLPKWLTVILMGSNKTPDYDGPEAH
jgi:hypothetical protein